MRIFELREIINVARESVGNCKGFFLHVWQSFDVIFFLPNVHFQCCVLHQGTLSHDFDIFAASSEFTSKVCSWKTCSRPIGVRVGTKEDMRPALHRLQKFTFFDDLDVLFDPSDTLQARFGSFGPPDPPGPPPGLPPATPIAGGRARARETNSNKWRWWWSVTTGWRTTTTVQIAWSSTSSRTSAINATGATNSTVVQELATEPDEDIGTSGRQ